MATQVFYTGDGATVTWNLTFPYRSQSDVKATVDGVNTAFTWASSSAITISPAVATGKSVRLYRQTSMTSRSVDFTDGSVLTENDLDADSLQAFNRLQELDTLITDVDTRTVKVPVGESGFSIPASATRANKALAFNESGSVIAISTSLLGADPDSIYYLSSGTGAVSRKLREKMGDVRSVKDFGAKGDGVTNDTGAFQLAFNSGAYKIVIPRGLYILDPLTVPDWLHIEGEAYQPGIGGSGRAVELRFNLTAGAALSCGIHPIIRNLFIQNTGVSFNETTKVLPASNSVAIQLTGNAVIEECSFSQWQDAIQTGASTEYLRTVRVHTNRCGRAYYSPSVTPYDMDIVQPHSELTASFLSGAGGAYARNVKVFGGSIENYTSIATHFQEIVFYGTYFETIKTGVTAISPGVNGCRLELSACHLNVTGTDRFIDLSGLTNANLVSIGNTLYGTGPAGGFYAYLPSTGDVTMKGDQFQPDTAHAATYLYVDSLNSALKFGGIEMPLLPAGNSQAAYSQMRIMGPRGFVMKPLPAAPASPVDGMSVYADGVSWDPLSRSIGRAYWTQYSNSAWRSYDGGA